MLQHRSLSVALGLVVLLSALFAFWNSMHFVHDDVMISLRYARNFVTHGELVWNMGERVEGYTNFLHVLLTSVPIALGVDPIMAAQGINLLGFALMVAMVWRVLRFLDVSGPACVLGLSAVCAMPPIAWVWGGLESPLVAGLVATALYLTIRAAHATRGFGYALAASVVFGLGYLTRPDVVVLNLAAGLALLIAAKGPFYRRFWGFFLIGVPSIAIVLAHGAFRWSYYGELLPMTYYAKVGVSDDIRLISGLRYLFHSLMDYPVPAIAGILGLGVMALRRRIDPEIAVPLLMLALATGYIAWSGGDHMPYARILVPLFPAAALALAVSVDHFRPVVVSIAATVGVGFAALSIVTTDPARPDPALIDGLVAGTHVAKTKPKDLLIATPTAGSLPYAAIEHRFVDTLGLTDPVIAKRENVPFRTQTQLTPGHSKGDGSYILSRKPDIILLGPGKGRPRSEADMWFLTEVELVENPEFLRCYEEVVENIPPDPDLWVMQYESEDPKFIYQKRVCQD